MSDSLETKAPLEPPPEGFRFSLRSLFLAVFCCALACAFWVWIVEPAKEAERRSQCVNNLKQIGLGLNNYADVYKHLPAAFTVDAKQTPMHSWRLSIVWFLNQLGQHFQDPFRYDEPWNSPSNLAASNRMGGYVWYCPSSPKSQPPTHANYVMPIGPRTISNGANCVALGQIRDGAAHTIVVGEIVNSDIYWTEPRDLSLETASLRINDRSRPSISSGHRGLATVLFADGHTLTTSDSIDPSVLEALLTIDGGEKIESGH